MSAPRPTRRDPGPAERRLVRRRRIVCLGLALCLIAVLAIDAVWRAARSDGTATALGASPSAHLAAVAAGETDPFLVEARSRVPVGFEEEAFSLAERAEVRIDDAGQIIGFTVPVSPETAFSQLKEELCRQGWTPVKSGSATSGSFAKQKGRLSWLFVSCTGASDATSVVVNCVVRDQEGGQP